MQVSESTASFLEAAADDLQRQLGRSGLVGGMDAVEHPDGVTLLATIRVGHGAVELTGTGANLVVAYGDLHRHVPEAILAAAYREVFGA